MSRRSWSALAAGALVFASLLAPAAAVAASPADDEDGGGSIRVTVPEGAPTTGVEIDDAQFRWAINAESGAGAFAGGCNFLSAGRAGDVGRGGVVWTESHGLYSAASGDARIEKPNAAGEYVPASFADRCLDRTGAPVSVSSLTSTSGNQVVIDGGRGTLADDGSLRIEWAGAFTVVFYGGMTYWSASDPVLTLDANGDGQVTATASGYGASMEDLTQWIALPERQIVLAEIRGADTGGRQGFATEPLYRGVQVSDAGQGERTTTNDAYWGSFPASFVQYQKLTGQAGYWLTTGGQRDPAKVASPLYVSYDASAPVAVAPPVAPEESAAPQNVVRTRPAALPASVPVPETVPVYPLADTATALPQGEGLVPGAGAFGTSPIVAPLLGASLAIATAIVAVLNLMQVLPWQRRPV